MGGLISLHGIAITKYGSIQGFADAMGWSRNKAMRLLKGIQEPSPQEICKMTEVLEIPTVDLFMEIFFRPLSTKWTIVNRRETPSAPPPA